MGLKLTLYTGNEFHCISASLQPVGLADARRKWQSQRTAVLHLFRSCDTASPRFYIWAPTIYACIYTRCSSMLQHANSDCHDPHSSLTANCALNCQFSGWRYLAFILGYEMDLL